MNRARMLKLHEFKAASHGTPASEEQAFELKLSQPSHNERKQTRQDQRGNGEDNELSWWPEGEGGEQSH